jgi:hypothetical protein
MVSFDAITALARDLGFTGRIAGLPVAAIFPLVIDVSISVTTLCLLAQSLAGATVGAEPHGGIAAAALLRVADEAAAEAHRVAPAFAAVHEVQPAPLAQALRDDQVSRASARVVEHTGSTACVAARPCPSRGIRNHHCRRRPQWQCVRGRRCAHRSACGLAETLVRNKLTRKDRGLLADGAAGLSCQAISDKHKVHHSAVRRGLQDAEPTTS